MSARVPFPFVAGLSILPAGDYTVRTPASGPARTVLLCDTEARVRAMLPSGPGEPVLGSGAKLLFHRTGDRFVISGLWSGRAAQ